MIDIEEKDSHGRTALRVAVQESNIEIAEMLLKAGASYNFKMYVSKDDGTLTSLSVIEYLNRKNKGDLFQLKMFENKFKENKKLKNVKRYIAELNIKIYKRNQMLSLLLKYGVK
jgi:ankyrin repeat protein